MKRRLPLVVLLLWSCAAEDRPGETVLRPGDEPDLGPVDAARIDGGGPDAAAPPDAAPDAAFLPPAVRTLVVLGDDAWSEGLRGALQPPQPPEASALEALATLPGAVPAVVWRGPESPGAATLRGLQRTGRPTAVAYDLAGRVAGAADPEAIVRADASWLAANALDVTGAARAPDGRAMLLVRGGAPRALDALRARLDALPVPTALVVEVDPALPPHVPPVADGVVPTSDRPEAGVEAWAAATRAAGRWWLPRAWPARNARLDAPEAPVPPDTGQSTLRRALIRARRAAGAWVLVDGLGGWRDDRQLEPVGGRATADPAALTDGLPVTPYGDARLEAVRALLLSEAGPLPLPWPPAEPPLLVVRRSEGVALESLHYGDDALRVALHDEGAGALEVVLDDRPFVMPPGLRLRYVRDDARLSLALVAAGEDGPSAALAPEDATRQVEMPLDAWAGRRIEEVVVVYRGRERGAMDGTVSAIGMSPVGNGPR